MAQKKTYRLTQKLLKGIRVDGDLYTLLETVNSQDIPYGARFCNVDGIVGIEYRDKDGKPHRDDGPARFLIDGTQTWFQHGLIHRDDDEPAIIYKDGEKHWYKEGKLHRKGAPAIMSPDGAEAWYLKGDCHRDDGPAITSAGGISIQYWRRGYYVCKWVIDKEIREKQKEQLIVDLKARVKELEE